MSEENQLINNEEKKAAEPAGAGAEIEIEGEEVKNAPVAQLKSKGRRGFGRAGGRKRGRDDRKEANKDEYEQKIIDIARVTRVMAGGKRMRFRACLALGNRAGKVGIGLAKAALNKPKRT